MPPLPPGAPAPALAPLPPDVPAPALPPVPPVLVVIDGLLLPHASRTSALITAATVGLHGRRDVFANNGPAVVNLLLESLFSLVDDDVPSKDASCRSQRAGGPYRVGRQSA